MSHGNDLNFDALVFSQFPIGQSTLMVAELDFLICKNQRKFECVVGSLSLVDLTFPQHKLIFLK